MTAMGNEPDLQVGDSGEWVANLQQRLQALALYQGPIDGQYGESTDAAVRELAAATGIDHAGMVSAATWQALAYQEQQTGGAAAYDYAAAGSGQLAEDGQVAGEGQHSESGQLSEDGQWRWDGAQWQPVGAGGDTADTAGAAQAGGDRYTIAVNDEVDDPSTAEAEVLA